MGEIVRKNLLGGSWALFLGFALLMVGNALQGTLLGVRAEIEGFSSETFGFVSAAYFAGFLGGSYLTPKFLRRVGHIRVFAAFASLISAAFILYAAIVDPIAWLLMRFLVGFCFSGVYIVMESWLNDAADNETRGQALALYVFTQMFSLAAGQQLLNLGDPAGYELFVLISVLVSVSFAPILLTVAPAPVYETAAPMSWGAFWRTAPLGFVGALLVGVNMGAMFGMGAIYGRQAGLGLFELSIFLTSLFLGAAALQMPIGRLSDRMDRRIMIGALGLAGAAVCVIAALSGDAVLGRLAGRDVHALYVIGFVIGGIANPLYALVIAHTNDYTRSDQMAAASGRLVFLNGVGAMFGPVAVGFMMSEVGPAGFWMVMGLCMAPLGGYAFYRITRRARASVLEVSAYAPANPRGAAVAAEMAQEVAQDIAHDIAEVRFPPRRGPVVRDLTAETAELEQEDRAAEERALEDADWEAFQRQSRRRR